MLKHGLQQLLRCFALLLPIRKFENDILLMFLVRKFQKDVFLDAVSHRHGSMVGPSEARSSDILSVLLIPLQDFFIDVITVMVQMNTHSPMADLIRANSKIH